MLGIFNDLRSLRQKGGRRGTAGIYLQRDVQCRTVLLEPMIHIRSTSHQP